jgi:hypothetical protein
MVYEQFEKSAAIYKLKHGKVPVIVIDNINRLANDTKNDGQEILEILQEGARDGVSESIFTTVFVTSDGTAPTQLRGKKI